MWVVIAWSLCYWLVSAQFIEESNITNLFVWDDALFGYDNTHKLSVDDITTTSITLKTPVLVDELSAKIKDYILLYGNHSFDELLDDPKLLTSFTEVTFSAESSDTTLTMTLDSNLNANSIYYVVAVPKDDRDMLGSVSNEICFRLKDKLYWEWNECSNSDSSTTTTHTASSWTHALELANIWCSWDGKKVTVNWVPVADIWNVKISLGFQWDSKYTIQGTVNVSNEKSFSFNVNDNRTPVIMFEPENWLSAYKTYTCHSLDTGTPTTSTTTGTKTKVTTVPTVWPKENILAVIAWAIILYVFYRVTRRKAD